MPNRALPARFRCNDCWRPHALQLAEQAAPHPPRCAQCAGPVRPDVVWFGEMLPSFALQAAWHAAEQCDVMLVVGDVNSTIACALVASKIAYPQPNVRGGPSRPLIAHVEAGLRSFDWEMPEEVNRVLTDALSDMLFTTEETAKQHLRKKGVGTKKIFFVCKSGREEALDGKKNL